MMGFLMTVAVEEPADSLLDRFLTGGIVLIRGMLTVFAVLCIIWGCLFVVRKIIEQVTGQASAPAPVQEAPAPLAQAVAPTPATDDGELIAVITAAIAAAEAETGHGGFRVVSFRRVNK